MAAYATNRYQVFLRCLLQQLRIELHSGLTKRERQLAVRVSAGCLGTQRRGSERAVSESVSRQPCGLSHASYLCAVSECGRTRRRTPYVTEWSFTIQRQIRSGSRTGSILLRLKGHEADCPDHRQHRRGCRARADCEPAGVSAVRALHPERLQRILFLV